MTLTTDEMLEQLPYRRARLGLLSTRPKQLRVSTLPELDPTKIPPRQWAYGDFLLFGKTTVLGAMDGAGKTAIAVVKALAMITGQPLLGERVWRTGPVAVVTYEDDEDEWHRRIVAACLHFGLDCEAVLRQIHFLWADEGERISFGGPDENSDFASDGDWLISELRALGAVLLIVDPFNHCHTYEDGNSNVTIARVASEMNRVAREAGVAGLVLHHLRKGATGSVDDLMGASSLRATFRSCRILARMDTDTAKQMNVRDPWRYTRIVDSKENYTPPPEKSTWFKLIGRELGNGTADYPDGDEVSVATRWTPSPIFEGMDAGMLRAVFAALRETPHGLAQQGKNLPLVSDLLKTIGRRNGREAKGIIDAWIENGVLRQVPVRNKSRNEVQGVALDEAKAAAILAEMKPARDHGAPS